jgi:hypothetical protein
VSREVRRSAPVDAEAVRRITDRLAGIQVALDPDADARALRATFAEVRKYRNVVTKSAFAVLPRLAEVKADLARIDQVIAAESAVILEEGRISHAKNADERKAAVRCQVEDLHRARAEVKADLHVLEEAASLVRWLRDELTTAFEEASRLLAAVDLEWRIKRGEP